MNVLAPTTIASLVVIAAGVLWGFYWIPVRALAALGLPGAWGSLVICAVATALMSPIALLRRRALRAADPWAVGATMLGGAAFVLYSIAFVFGDVAMVILLFYLTPVWSTLIARYILGWPTTRLRILAIAVGLIGLAVMLSEGGGGAPWPGNAGEWLALVSGLLWSIATTGLRLRPNPRPPEAAFLFALGATLGAALLLPAFGAGRPTPHACGDWIFWALAAGGLWWALSIMGLLWATARLEPARVGILLMAEVVIGAGSAAILAGESLGAVQMIGGALVLAAALIEFLPVGPRKPHVP